MRERRALRTGFLVRQAYAWCVLYFAVTAAAWLVLPRIGEPFAVAGAKMLPVAILTTAVATLGWLTLRRHPDLLGWLLAALLAATVVATAVTVGVPPMSPIVTAAIVFFDYLIPVFLGIAAWSAARVLAGIRDAERTRRARVRPPSISLDGYEADPDQRNDR